MKKLIQMMPAGIIFLLVSAHLSAQTFSPANKLLVDNEHITAKELTFEPGIKTPVHTHPAHFIYALTPGKLVVTMESGEIQTHELKAGDSAFLPPEGPHMTVNPGKQPVKLLLVELKAQPYIQDAKMK